MKKLRGLLIFFLNFYKCVSLDSSMKIITEVGKKVYLPCGVPSQGDISWLQNGNSFIKYKRYQKLQNPVKDLARFSVQDHSSSDMEVNNVQLIDSGTYSCQKDKNTRSTVTLVVFEVSATPSKNLISSEDLMLKVKLSPEGVQGLQVSWMRGEQLIRSGTSLEIKNVDLEHNGQYWCHVKMEGAEAKSSTEIKVNGVSSGSSSIVFIKEPKSVVLPWRFNFKVRSMPLLYDVKVVEGSVTYPSQVVNKLDNDNGAPCWPADCASGADVRSLDIHISNPKIGDYQMEIVLEIEGRRKRLETKVCVANLTVSSSEDNPSMESSVTLQCQINCLGKNQKLCWQNKNINHEKCGPPGQTDWSEEVTVLPEILGNWTCSVVLEQQTIFSANLTLEVPAGVLDTSGFLFWVTVGVGVLILLLIMVIIVIVVARSRRLRRAQKRAWLLQNIHQQKRCECKGFPPQRLQENV